MRSFDLMERLRSFAGRARTAAALTASVIVCEVGARIGLPGVDSNRVREVMHGLPRGLLALYNVAVGGAISRAALLALGAVPYFQARLYLWIARQVSARRRRATAHAATHRSLVRIATVGIALVQSFGFARFLEKIPGAVVAPGPGFVVRTVLLLTGGAIAVGWLAELTFARQHEDEVDSVGDGHTSTSHAAPTTQAIAVDASAALPGTPVVPLLTSASVAEQARPVAAQVEMPIRRAEQG